MEIYFAIMLKTYNTKAIRFFLLPLTDPEILEKEQDLWIMKKIYRKILL